MAGATQADDVRRVDVRATPTTAFDLVHVHPVAWTSWELASRSPLRPKLSPKHRPLSVRVEAALGSGVDRGPKHPPKVAPFPDASVGRTFILDQLEGKSGEVRPTATAAGTRWVKVQPRRLVSLQPPGTRPGFPVEVEGDQRVGVGVVAVSPAVTELLKPGRVQPHELEASGRR